MKNKLRKDSKYGIIIFMLSCFFVTAYSQTHKWKTENGWALRETAPNSNIYEKYFAVGIWGIPHYILGNSNSFMDAKSHFNTFIVQSGHDNPAFSYFDNVTLIAGLKGIKSNLFHNYPDTNDFMTKYLRMRKVLSPANSSITNKKIDESLEYTKGLNIKRDFIWTPFDEPAGGDAGWCWTPSFTDTVYQRAKNITKSNLVFLNLTGSLKGDIYFFNKLHSIEETPDPFLYRDRSLVNCDSLIQYFAYKYDGTPRFECSNNGDTLRERADSRLDSNYYKNTYNLALDYINSCDIIGIDDYGTFYTDPRTVGLAVHALKAGSGGDKPIWLYFDGNGYRKPSTDDMSTFVKKIKCQIFTAIINGATGILFWNDLRKPDDIYNQTKLLADTLKYYEEIIKGENVETNLSVKDWSANYKLDKQYIIKRKSNGKQYIIAVNQNATGEILLNVPGFPVKVLSPFEVFISSHN